MQGMMLAKLIAAYRSQTGLSVRDLAKEIGIDYTALWRLEQGRMVTTVVWVAVMKWIVLEPEKPQRKPKQQPVADDLRSSAAVTIGES
jgi:ribosome-binding protein aMBF1 (putative translation factor)